MNAIRAWKPWMALRAAGPYLLIELILPGGTLVAFLLWLSQRLNRDGFSGVRQLLSAWRPANAIQASAHRTTAAAPVEPLAAAVR